MRIAVLPGDGIGPEITDATLQALSAADRKFRLGIQTEVHPVGVAALKASGTTLPDPVMAACRAADGFILGPVQHTDYPAREKGGINVSGELRVRLDLYANIRPARSRDGLPHWGRTPMDLVIARENTEGFYADRNMHLGIAEIMPSPDMALSVRKITRQASSRIARVAFDLARRRRKKITAVHKINVLKVTEALFLEAVREVARGYPDVKYEEQLVDSMAALLVRDAARFDVVVTTNMYGDILSDEASELSGSLGLAPSINAGDEHCMAQAQHGSAPDIAGQGIANPASLILSTAMLLEWLGTRQRNESLASAARAITSAVDALVAAEKTRTKDLGGPLTTAQFGAAVAASLG